MFFLPSATPPMISCILGFEHLNTHTEDNDLVQLAANAYGYSNMISSLFSNNMHSVSKNSTKQ